MVEKEKFAMRKSKTERMHGMERCDKGRVNDTASATSVESGFGSTLIT